MVSNVIGDLGGDHPLDAVFERTDCTYQDSSERFHHVSKDFSRQFFHIYAQRLNVMKEIIKPRIELEWGSSVPIKRLADLTEDETQPCAIIGTLFKHQELKPSILKEISEEYQLIPQPERVHFTDDGDQLILEDDLQRIRLLGNLDVHSVVTGIVCAVYGVQDDGKFLVEKYLFADIVSRPSVGRPITLDEDRFVVFISGLELASNAEPYFALQLFVDWVSGWIGNITEQQQLAKIARVIVAGNIVRGSSQCRTKKISNVSESLDSSDSLEGIKLADEFLQQLAMTVPVDIMPGEFDPTNCIVPQQPLHCCMFPQAAAFKTFHSATNPYECKISGKTILGTSGQGINDVAAYSRLTDNLDILEKSLQWGHLMPTAPDTLKCFPYYEKDPFIIPECPDIYFSGNMTKFQTKLLSGAEGRIVRLLCIPKFSTTHSCVVVNLKNLDCYPVSFGIGKNNTDTPFDVDK